MKHMAQHLGDDLAGALYTSRCHCRNSPEVKTLMGETGMQLDHAQALYLYTVESPLYVKLNKALRSESRLDLKTHFPPIYASLWPQSATYRGPQKLSW